MLKYRIIDSYRVKCSIKYRFIVAYLAKAKGANFIFGTIQPFTNKIEIACLKLYFLA